MDKQIIKQFYLQIKSDVEQYYLQSSTLEYNDIFEPYRQYLLPFVEVANLDAILQYASIMAELNFDEEQIITFLTRYRQLFVNTADDQQLARYDINLVYYQLAANDLVDYSQLLLKLLNASKVSEYPQVFSLLGYCYCQLGQYQQAKKYYSQALKLRDSDVDLFNYQLLDIYQNELPISEHLRQSDFTDEYIIELVTEYRENTYLEKLNNYQFVLACNLVDCVIHCNYN